MLEISEKTNLLEQKSYRYQLQDVSEPNLYRDVYNYEEVPRVAFNHRRVPIGMPDEIWITDTTFRDGQQSIEPYTVDQIVDLFKLISRLGGPFGIIRQTERGTMFMKCACGENMSPAIRAGPVSSVRIRLARFSAAILGLPV